MTYRQHVNIDYIVAVPEPLTMSIFGAGILGAAAMRRRKKKVQATYPRYFCETGISKGVPFLVYAPRTSVSTRQSLRPAFEIIR